MQPHQNQAPELSAKLIFLGDSTVGKSSLLIRACGEGFSNRHIATIGVDFKQLKIEIDGWRVRVQLWDTSGQERYESITAAFYRKVSGVILCYAIDDRKSFERVSHWMKQLHMHGSENVCKILVATKGDLDLERVVEESEGRRLAASYGIEFMETSAKEDRNVKEAVEMITKKAAGIRERRKTLKPIEPKKKKCFVF